MVRRLVVEVGKGPWVWREGPETSTLTQAKRYLFVDFDLETGQVSWKVLGETPDGGALFEIRPGPEQAKKYQEIAQGWYQELGNAQKKRGT